MEEKKKCSGCPVCGYDENSADSQDFEFGEFYLTFICEECGTEYYEVFTHAYTTWTPED